MRHVLSRLFAAMILLAPIARVAAAPDVELDTIAGKYNVEGEGQAGRKYDGTLTLTRRGDVIEVKWVLNTGEEYIGVGFITGTLLSVGWQVQGTGGVAVYDFSTKPVSGRWSLVGDETVYKERLTRK